MTDPQPVRIVGKPPPLSERIAAAVRLWVAVVALAGMAACGIVCVIVGLTRGWW